MILIMTFASSFIISNIASELSLFFKCPTTLENVKKTKKSCKLLKKKNFSNEKKNPANIPSTFYCVLIEIEIRSNQKNNLKTKSIDEF